MTDTNNIDIRRLKVPKLKAILERKDTSYTEKRTEELDERAEGVNEDLEAGEVYISLLPELVYD